MSKIEIKKWNLICLVAAVVILIVICVMSFGRNSSTHTKSDVGIGATITPIEYGAVANGKHDDTTAIQKCIADNPNAIITFPEGTYAISDTIYLYGNQGGQHIDFGGSYFKWIGKDDPEATMFEIADPESGKLSMVGTSESRALLTGGTFYGADACGTAIKSNAFHSTIADFKCYDFTSSEIIIGSDDGGRSLQNHVSNGLIFMSHKSSQGWSDENKVAGLSIFESDNLLDSININRCNTSVLIAASGNEFYNCHFTAQYREALSELADTCAVCIDPVSPDHMFSDDFENCYFDNHKYCFKVEKETNKYINLSNGKYYFSGGLLSKDIPACDAYLLGGNSIQINVDNFTIIPSDGRMRFHDSSWVSNVNQRYLSVSKEQYNDTTYTLDDGINVPYLAQYLTENGEIVPIADKDDSLKARTYYEVGCITIPDLMSLEDMPETQIQCIKGDYLQNWVLSYQAENNSVSLQAKDMDSSGLQIIAGAPETIVQDDIQMKYIPLYLYSDQELEDPLIDMQITTCPPVRGYLYTLKLKERN